ncbi:MAG: hypothetical protein HY817_05395 [Candidatus Abawacabacteria bacterium]|nr:hypothetical protein [Candidatus Abawacabacteria bacterium]
MELRSLSDQNVLAKTSNAPILFIPNPSQINGLINKFPEVKIVVTFSETKTTKSNREVLICDWPGEYERSDTSIIGLHMGCFVIALEGKYWLIAVDTALKSLDKDNEYLSNVAGLMVWVTDEANKSNVQEAISHLAPTYIVYCVSADKEVLIKDLTPPPMASVQELTIKASELDGESEQIKAQALIV